MGLRVGAFHAGKASAWAGKRLSKGLISPWLAVQIGPSPLARSTSSVCKVLFDERGRRVTGPLLVDGQAALFVD